MVQTHSSAGIAQNPLLVFVFFLCCGASPFFGFSQTQKCDSGYSYMPTISTGSLIIKADTCLPDSVCKKLWKEFDKNLCGETQTFSMSDIFMYSDFHTWSDSLGCISKETYKMKVKDKWVEISKCKYYWLNKGTTCSTWSDDKSIKISCCGHTHLTEPK